MSLKRNLTFSRRGLAILSILSLASLALATNVFLSSGQSNVHGEGEYTYGSRRSKTYISSSKGSVREVSFSVHENYAVVEGDIILATLEKAEKAKVSVERDDGIMPRGIGISGRQFLWTDHTIPYVVDGSLTSSRRTELKNAIQHWEARTLIRFRVRTHETNYVAFVGGRGCKSQVGMQGGRQVVVLGPECEFGNIVHEIGHTVGLWHEQSRKDRDSNVTIAFDNIVPQARPEFEQRISDGLDLQSYDYASVMHYASNAFAVDPDRPTIIAPRPIGQRKALSDLDVRAVFELYE